MTQLEQQVLLHIKRAAHTYVEKNIEVDWEQRKFEIAKELYVKQFNGFHIKADGDEVHADKDAITKTMRLCVEYADTFIQILKNE